MSIMFAMVKSRETCYTLEKGGCAMSYESVLEQIKDAPEECLEEISQIIGYVVHRYEQKTAEEQKPSPRLADAMLEALQISGDPNVKGFTDTAELFKDLNS